MFNFILIILGFSLVIHAEEGPNHPARTSKYLQRSRIALNSCGRSLTKLSWGYNKTTKGYPAICKYEPAFESMVYCMNEIYQNWGLPKDRLASTAGRFNTVCQYYYPGQVEITGDQIMIALENATLAIQKRYNASAVQYAPVAVNATAVKKQAKAFYTFYRNLDQSNVYGGAICGYFLGIFVVAAFIKFMKAANILKALLKLKVVNYIRSYIVLPTLHHRHAQGFGFWKVFTGLIPTRLETLLVTGYIIIHTVLIAVDYRIDTKNLLFSTKEAQVARFLADRTGIIAFAHFPLIVLFATRNNFFQWITGLHYTTFIVFHKWVSRIMFLDALIHSAAYTHYTIISKSWQRTHTQTYWEFGIAATILAGLMLLFACYYLRKNYYETFLYAHIILGALFFYACWEHVCEMGWIEWIYVAIALWAVDRIVRVLRIFVFGFPEASFKLLDNNLVRISIPKKSGAWFAKPGQYAFIYFWHPKYFWQSHPFTVMDSLVHDNEVVIVYKPKEGLTRYLKNKVEKKGGEMKMRVSLEGPYGCSSALHCYETILLLVGGSGLPGPTCHAIDLAKKYGGQGKKKIKFVLTMRGTSVLNAFEQEMQKMADLGVDVELYDTSLPDSYHCSSEESSKNLDQPKDDEEIKISKISSSNDHLGFPTTPGRPPLDKVIEEAIEGSSGVSIFCCGPSMMVDTIRDLTACFVRKFPQTPIEYFEDYQNW